MQINKIINLKQIQSTAYLVIDLLIFARQRHFLLEDIAFLLQRL
jgi:hypothetical protein